MKSEERAALRRLDKQFDAIRAMPVPTETALRHRHGIEDVKLGGYLRIGGEIYRVAELSIYREKQSHWTELALFGLNTGETRHLEWEKDDEIEVSLNGPPIALRELGVEADRIEAMADEERGTLTYQGKRFHYDDDYGAHFYRDGDGTPEPVYFYDFETEDERFCLSVEEWGSKEAGFSYDVYVAEYFEPEDVEVLVPGGS